MLVGVLSDTHGVWDPAVAELFRGVDQILHAGDVGNHGGHAAVLGMLRPTAPVAAVSGNVDDDDAAAAELPAVALLMLAGWSVLLVHILESGEAAAAIRDHQPDLVVHGHSHAYSERVVNLPGGGRRLLLNPGSAGPARFKLGRSVALLHLPQRGGGAWPTVQRVDLAAKAPKRLPEACRSGASRPRGQRAESLPPGRQTRRAASHGGKQSKRRRV